MKATPTRIQEEASALVVPDPAGGQELLLTETGHRALQSSLGHEVEATKIAAGSLLAGSLFMLLAASSFVNPLVLAPLVPVALLGGALWGHTSFQRKLRRMARGQIPRHAVLGGGRKEVFIGAGLLGGLLLGMPTPVALTLFFVMAAGAIGVYGRRSRSLALEMGDVFERARLGDGADLELLPEEMAILGQGPAEGGHCPVCGDPLTSAGASVYCEDCGTGHHPECWTYTGTCSRFGCGGQNVSTAAVDALLEG